MQKYTFDIKATDGCERNTEFRLAVWADEIDRAKDLAHDSAQRRFKRAWGANPRETIVELYNEYNF